MNRKYIDYGIRELHEIYRVFDRVSSVNDITPDALSKLIYGISGQKQIQIEKDDLFNLMVVGLVDFIAGSLMSQPEKIKNRFAKMESTGVYSLMQMFLCQNFTVLQHENQESKIAVKYTEIYDFLEERDFVQKS